MKNNFTPEDIEGGAEEIYWGAKTDDPDPDAQKHFKRMMELSEWIQENSAWIAALPAIRRFCDQLILPGHRREAWWWTSDHKDELIPTEFIDLLQRIQK